jgi:hypothetical protein
MSEYKEKLKSLWSGVAVLKLDDSVKFWTRSATGAGFQIEGHRTRSGGDPGIIVKAKLDGKYVCPRKLKNRKVFYRFYREQDMHGVWRSYLYLASRSGDFVYRGSRVVVISKNGGAFLVAEPSMRERLTELWKEESGGVQPEFGWEDYAAVLMPQEGY